MRTDFPQKQLTSHVSLHSCPGAEGLVTNLTAKLQALALSGSSQPPALRSKRAVVESHKMSPLCVCRQGLSIMNLQ